MTTRPGVVLTRLLAATVSVGALVVGAGTATGQPPTATPTTSSLPAKVVLPRDEAAHPAPTEWWYFNGHLSAVDPRGRRHRYGFEYVTFKFEGQTRRPVYVADFAVTDLARRRFSYAARAGAYPRPDDRDSFALHTAGWSMSGARGRNALHAVMPGYALRLRTVSTGPASRHGTDGVVRFTPFGRSAYYSRTSLGAGGTIVDHGVRMRVTGTAWMDHQWGPFDFTSGGGWDWFGLQLRDGTRYMLYFLRTASGRVVETLGTRVTARGRTLALPARSYAEHPTGTWTSPATGITYSSGWELRVPGGRLSVRPRLLDQELDVRAIQGVAYWEGDVAVRGTVAGRPVRGSGYTEINPPAGG